MYLVKKQRVGAILSVNFDQKINPNFYKQQLSCTNQLLVRQGVETTSIKKRL